jgi:uncharacterized protein (TIGR02246 family)
MIAIGLVLFCIGVGRAAASEPPTEPEAAIRKAVEDYVAAFNNSDSAGVAAMWAPEAVYIDPVTGNQAVGREAIEKQFAGIFEHSKGIQLEATTEAIQFISPGVAVEHGVAKLVDADQGIEKSAYTAVYVKIDGAWLLDRVTEEPIIEPVSNYEQLKELEWMVGRWVDQDDRSTVVTECDWTRNKNFLVRSFAIQVRDRVDMSGIQLVGWDPSAQKIRSWVFDSDGGFGQGTWSKKDNRWLVHQTGVLPDGRKASAVNVITYLDDNTFTLQSVNRMVDGELLPNIDEVKVTKE